MVNTSESAAAAPILNGWLIVPVVPLPVAVSVYPVPARLMLSAEKVARPAEAAIVRTPPSVAPGVPVPPVIDSETLPM